MILIGLTGTFVCIIGSSDVADGKSFPYTAVGVVLSLIIAGL